MTEQEVSIGQRLKAVRINHIAERKLSINEFANLVGENQFNISNYESGKANVPNRLLIKLYEKGINPTWILTGEEDVFSAKSREKQDKLLSNFNASDLAILARAGDIMQQIANMNATKSGEE